MIARVFDWFAQAGISQASICANGDTPDLRRFLGSGTEFHVKLEYYQDVMPRGPAGSIRDAALGSSTDHFVALDATVLPRFDLSRALAHHLRNDAALTVVVSRADRPGELAPAGIYIVSRRALECVPDTGYQDLKEGLIPRLHAIDEEVIPYEVPACQVLRMRGPDAYLAGSQSLLAEHVARRVCPPGYNRRGEAWVHWSASVADDVRIVGPAIIQAESIIKTGAVLIGPSFLGRRCRIGTKSVVSRSVMWNDCRTEQMAVVDQCVLTSGSIVEAGSTVRAEVLFSSARQTRLDTAAHTTTDLGLFFRDSPSQPARSVPGAFARELPRQERDDWSSISGTHASLLDVQ